ncbi:hypothetical protein LZZ85_02020 [Terrimonas sp. NA20]|uniref:Uncharacterized protein n=1 Tax=Terrimonas ginsenosidimutans TaxID=2908004 RepID=A0ABS9KL33_9BACT|nr:hypothetical protein [Terrimonas ginsenosidimutans]MCG2613029.1 hypothetical protein [Terrimonas ginsenosidimutans]
MMIDCESRDQLSGRLTGTEIVRDFRPYNHYSSVILPVIFRYFMEDERRINERRGFRSASDGAAFGGKGSRKARHGWKMPALSTGI